MLEKIIFVAAATLFLWGCIHYLCEHIRKRKLAKKKYKTRLATKKHMVSRLLKAGTVIKITWNTSNQPRKHMFAEGLYTVRGTNWKLKITRDGIEIDTHMCPDEVIAIFRNKCLLEEALLELYEEYSSNKHFMTRCDFLPPVDGHRTTCGYIERIQ